MNRSDLPFKQLVFVCTNARNPGERISCAGDSRCGEKLLETLRAFVKKNQLQDVARIAKAGCMEQCEKGPAVAVMPQNVMLTGVTEADAEQIISSYLSPLLSARASEPGSSSDPR